MFRRKLKIFAPWLFLLFMLPLHVVEAARSPVDEVEELTLEAAIAKGLRSNPAIVGRRLDQEINEMSYQTAWEKMFLPSLSFNAVTTSYYSVGQLGHSPATMPNKEAGRGNMQHGAPTGTQTYLGLGQYTLFNFGKDRDTYEIAKMNMERSRQTMKEAERQIRFDVISKVYTLKTKQDLLDISKRTVDSAKAVVELVRSRIAVGKAKENDLSSADVDLLTAQNQLLGDETTYNQSLWDVNTILGDELNHKYLIKAKIDFKKMKMTMEEALKAFQDNAPAIRDAKLSLESARIAYRRAQKDSLPLPTVTFTGINLGYAMGTTKSTPIRDTTGGSTSGNFDIVTGLNFTIPLWGDGGFLGGRTRRAAEIAEEKAEIALRVASNASEYGIRSIYTQFSQQETSIENAQKIYRDTGKIFEAALHGLQGSANFNRLELKDAITQLRSAEQNYTNLVLSHYALKLSLASAIGVDEFPEDKL